MQDYYCISEEELGKGAKIPILKLGDSGEVYYELAMEMLSCIARNNADGRPTVFICPVGPVGQYPIFIRLVNQQKISLKNCWFINMDEYLTDSREYIPMKSSLSFRGFMEREVYSRLSPELAMPENQRIFPNPACPEEIARTIEKLGGVDIAFGGIGINGHLAFNEPEPALTAEAFSALPTRVLEISPETRTANAIGDLGGALDAMPRYCITIGMAQILGARRVRLGVFRDWHRSVVRRAAYGEVSSSFAASLLQNHPDALILANRTAAARPFEP